MNFKHIAIVLKKELRDLFRDKRTWIASVLVPVLVFPLMFYLMGIGQNKMKSNLEKEISIAVEGTDVQNDLVNYINGTKGIKVVAVEDPYQALEEGTIKTILVIESGFKEKLKAQLPIQIKLVYDEVSSESSMASSVVEDVISEYSEGIRLERLNALGIDPDRLNPTIITQEAYIPEGEESKGSGVGLMMMTFLLPFLLMLYPVVGGMPAAIDLGAGEKERLSLEPLLSTGADRMSILVGKYITVLITSIIGVITSIVGILVAAKLSPEMVPLGVKISPLSMLILVGVSLTIAMILSGLMLSISVFAKSYKEAGTYLSPITIILMVPTYLTMFMDVKRISTGLFFIPLLNSVLLMKEALLDIINPLHMAITFSISLVLVGVSLLFMKYMFNKESVIFRS